MMTMGTLRDMLNAIVVAVAMWSSNTRSSIGSSSVTLRPKVSTHRKVSCISEKNASQAVIDKALEKEGRAILANVRKGAALVALCVEGKLVSSEELAAAIADRAMSGAGDMAFVIGSSHGLAPMVKQAAAMKISLGRITLPHQLARLVLTEQLYRAFAINNHIKYHK